MNEARKLLEELRDAGVTVALDPSGNWVTYSPAPPMHGLVCARLEIA